MERLAELLFLLTFALFFPKLIIKDLYDIRFDLAKHCNIRTERCTPSIELFTYYSNHLEDIRDKENKRAAAAAKKGSRRR